MFKSRGSAVDKANDCLIFEAKQFELPNEPRPIDVLQRRAVIGEYYTMQNHLRGAIKPEEYTSRMRDIFVYNEDKDGFSRISLDAALDNCCRFRMGGDGGLDWDHANQVANWDDFYKAGSDGVPKDMFAHYHNGDLGSTLYFGDMHTDHLRDDGLTDWCDSVLGKLKLGGMAESAILEGLELCRELSESTESTAAQEFWMAWLYLVHATKPADADWDDTWNIPRIPVLSEIRKEWEEAEAQAAAFVQFNDAAVPNAGNPWLKRKRFTLEIFHTPEANAPQVGTRMFHEDGRALFTPVGYGNYAGLCMLADPRYAGTFPEHHRRASAFVKAFDQLYREMQLRFADSVLLDKAFQPPWFYRQDGRQTLFSNIMRDEDGPLEFELKKSGEKLDLTFPRLITQGNAPPNAPWAVKTMTLVADGAADGADIAMVAPQPGLDAVRFVIEDYLRHVFGEIAEHSVPTSEIASFFGNKTLTERLKDEPRDTSTLRYALRSILTLASKASVEEERYVNQSVERVKALVRRVPALFAYKDCFLLKALVKSLYDYRHTPRNGEDLDRIVNLHQLLSDDCATSAQTPYHALVAVLAIYNLSVNSKKEDEPTDGDVIVTKFRRACVAVADVLGTLAAEMAAAAANNDAKDRAVNKASNSLKLPVDDSTAATPLSGLPVPSPPANTETVKKNLFPQADGVAAVEKELAIDTNNPGRALMRFDAGSGKTVVQTHLTIHWETLEKNTLKQDDKTAFSVIYFGGAAKTASSSDRSTPGPMIKYGAAHAWHASKSAGPAAPAYGAGGGPAGTARFGAYFSADTDEQAKRRKREDERYARLRRGNFAPSEEQARRDESPGTWEAGGWVKGPDGAVHSFLEISETLAGRWTELRQREGRLGLAVKMAFLLAPVNGLSLRALIRKNDVFPFGFLLFRPGMTYLMGSGILTQSGARTGETLIGHADFQLADNVVQKMHIGNFTMYLKSIVYQQQNVYIAENIFAQGYLYGNNAQFFSKEDRNKYTPKEAVGPQKSMYAALVPYECSRSRGDSYYADELPNPLDITGSYNPSNPALAEFAGGSAAGAAPLHYASAKYYSSLFSWNNTNQDPLQEGFNSYNRYNTLCFQGHQAMFNPASKNYDLVQANTGHWGNRVYAGCGKVRKGLQKMLEPVTYANAYGGDSGRAMVTIGY